MLHSVMIKQSAGLFVAADVTVAVKTAAFGGLMNTLYQGDNLTISIDSEVDLIVTSPPYNLGIDYQSADDNLDYGKYLKFTKSYLTRFYESLKPDGRLCLNIPLDKNKGGQKSVGADITTIAKSVGFQYQSTIVWNEGNISKRTAWGSWMKASAPYVIAPVELIVIFYKEQWKKESGSGKSDIQRDEFIEWTNGLWTFPGDFKWQEIQIPCGVSF